MTAAAAVCAYLQCCSRIAFCCFCEHFGASIQAPKEEMRANSTTRACGFQVNCGLRINQAEMAQAPFRCSRLRLNGPRAQRLRHLPFPDENMTNHSRTGLMEQTDPKWN
ncbi:hypothetical protein EJ05DRAFT_476558 [Pseudovirgaria hyperparasitica]|uniref:Uncharacterized protein n=1 Tax=Pseudovirgaria hyperparasitica TaxID=470096 RepID=A0A6A6W527_9PEZI|nr:uncharacterized protein EJ05DRAFT_476558 [Pseudovirgaria hyperparasitica]KAF2757279.1 hypothetical protein EJ05DRAFT_476558 [Pseudovirgaria hyperparasitica]